MSEQTITERIKRSSRPTIMDGEVVSFAQHFEHVPGILGGRDEAQGAFHVSASRNAVIVHRCEIRGRGAFEEFWEAMRQAYETFAQLSGRREW